MSYRKLILFVVLCGAFVLSQFLLAGNIRGIPKIQSVADDDSEMLVQSKKEDVVSENLRPQKIKERGLEDSQDFRELTEDTVDFTRENLSSSLADFLEFKIWGYRIASIFIAVFALFLAWILQHYLVRFVFAILTRNAKSQSRKILSHLKTPISALIILFACDTAILMVSQNEILIVLARRISTILFIVFICWLLQVLCEASFKLAEERMGQNHSTSQNLLDFLNRICRYCLVVVALLLILDSCGANINTIIASLGIGGAALAFASKDTIANFFGSISLIIDKPFVVGDTIFISNLEGKVEKIGFRSTRIRTPQCSVMTIPNSVLANEIIENSSRRNKRRISMNIGLAYSTTPTQILEIIDDIRTIIENNPKTDADETRVHFAGFGESSLDISVVYYLYELDAMKYADAVQDINIDIMKVVQKNGLSFAFPSRSLYIEQIPVQKNSLAFMAK